MDFIGYWKFHSIGTFDDNNVLVYLSAEEYLNSDMPYIDTSDEEAVADEMKERKMCIGSKIKITEDGKVYMLAPLPEGVTDEQVDEAVKGGLINLMDGMICGDQANTWELRDGEFWCDMGIEGEIMGEKVDSFIKPIDNDGFFNLMNMRFVKE